MKFLCATFNGIGSVELEILCFYFS